MISIRDVAIIGSQMDLGAVRKGVDMGPLAIRHAGLTQRIKEMGINVKDCGDVVVKVVENEGDPKLRYAYEINDANTRLYHTVLNQFRNGHFPIVLGGDHSIAAGSISASMEHYGKIGVIWIDAHGDYNDEKITPSGNMHGMPLSALCGYGPDCMVAFTKQRLSPENVAIVGARALDPLEIVKLKDTGVNVFSISDVHANGMLNTIREAIKMAGEGTAGIHLSMDMDALDPTQAPGVGTPVYNGLTQREVFIACEELHRAGKLIAMDLVETNPLLDKRNITGHVATEIILSCLGCTSYN